MSENRVTIDDNKSVKSVSEIETKKTVYEKAEDIISKRVFTRAITFVIALLLLILAFCPFAYTNVEDEDGLIKIKFNTVDCMSLSVKSFSFLEEEDILKNIEGDIDDYYSENFKELISIYVMHEDVSIRGTILFAGLISLMYIGFCIVFFIFAFVGLITAKKSSSDKNIADFLLCALLCFIPVVIFAFLLMCHFGKSGVFYLCYGKGVGVSWGAVLSVILALCGVVLLFVKNFLKVTQTLRRYFAKTKAKAFVCMALIALVIISAFLPCINVNVYDPWGSDKEEKLELKFSDVYEVSSDEMKYYSTVVKGDSYNHIIECADKTVHDSKSNKCMAENIFNTFISGCCRFDVRESYMFIELITVVILVFAGILLLDAMIKMIFEKTLIRKTKPLKILTLIFSCVNFSLIIFLLCIANLNMYGNLVNVLSFTIGTGTVLMPTAIIAFMVLSLEFKKYVYIEKGYDNADVSYAPYVVDKK